AGSFERFASTDNFYPPGWPACGQPVTQVVGDQINPAVVSDGSGGTIVAWEDHRGADADIYAQRMNPFGEPLWLAGGVPLCKAIHDQIQPSIVSDGAGGAVVSWKDFRAGTAANVFAQRVDANGVTLWTTNGVPLCTLGFVVSPPAIASDGA